MIHFTVFPIQDFSYTQLFSHAIRNVQFRELPTDWLCSNRFLVKTLNLLMTLLMVLFKVHTTSSGVRTTWFKDGVSAGAKTLGS